MFYSEDFLVMHKRLHDLRLSRRSLGHLFTAAAVSFSTVDSLALAPQAFRLTLPSSFVKLSTANSPEVLLSAGDFRGMIASTGAATTISVQRLDKALSLLPRTSDDPTAATAAAEAFARLRDSQSGLPAGCTSVVLPSTVSVDQNGVLGFEFLTPLTGNEADPTVASPDLVRHSLVRAAASGLESGSDSTTGTAIILWAGARATDWDAGAGAEIREAAATFAVEKRRL